MTTWFISRHPGAITWAAQHGLPVERHERHLDPTQVQAGDIVIGTLPVHLAAAVCQRGARFLNLSLDLPTHWRGRELSVEELRQCNARLEGFEIRPTGYGLQPTNNAPIP
jgi:CRISPR-associated protein Csx16